ncbi:MAG TPA: hypothetical protein VEC57_18850 [Candidatus Limnocylindrales bacterium]|nr:hypothetical protein [Candidatus Limnocylindrales bacterium]
MHGSRILAQALGLLLLAAAATAERAEARRVHLIQQATNLTVGSIYEPNIRQGRGEYITFTSDGDVLGFGTAHLGRREVYLWSRDDRASVRVTESGLFESYDASRVTDDFRTQKPSIIAFISTADLDPSVGNADANPELFIWRLDNQQFRQLTDTVAPVINELPRPSDTADCIVFQSTGDLDDNDGSFPGSAPSGFHNEDGSLEVFYVDFHDNELTQFHITQISDGPVGTRSENGSPGGYFFPNQCANIAYQSDHDQFGDGATGVNVYDYRKGSAVRDLVSEPGNLDGLNIDPRMSGTGVSSGGPSTVFASNANLWNNGSSGFQIFKFAILTGALRQLTGDPNGGHRRPSVSDGSTVVVFESTGEPADPALGSKRGPDGPHNADGNSEIVRFVGKRVVRPITRTTGCTNDLPSIMGNGRGIAFRSDCDLVAGHNSAGVQQVFAYYELHRGEELYQIDECAITGGCCSTANGCYEEVVARAYSVPRPGQ